MVLGGADQDGDYPHSDDKDHGQADPKSAGAERGLSVGLAAGQGLSLGRTGLIRTVGRRGAGDLGRSGMGGTLLPVGLASKT
jgi:hypothetical protein